MRRYSNRSTFLFVSQVLHDADQVICNSELGISPIPKGKRVSTAVSIQPEVIKGLLFAGSNVLILANNQYN